MAESNEGGPIFVDVGGSQDQFPMQQSNFVVFTHLTKHTGEMVKQELADEVVPINQNAVAQKNTTSEFEYPVENKHLDIRENETPQTDMSYLAEVNTDKSETKKMIRCTEKPNGISCSYKTNTQDRLIRHIRKVHRGENPFQCTMCDYSTYNKALFEEHVRIHKGIKPFKCRVCSYRSVSKKNTKKHELIHRPDNPLRCQQCDFIARHERSLQVHLQMHSGHVKCSSCDFKAKNPKLLQAHRRKEHGVGLPKLDYSCDRCDAKFSELKSVTVHKKKAKECEECGILLCTKMQLNAHMQMEHQKASEGDKIFICAICHWSSSSKVRTLLHLIHHPNQKVDEKLVDITILRKFGIME